MLEARAFNQSIAFMVVVPYATLAILGFVIWRKVKAAQKAALLPETG